MEFERYVEKGINNIKFDLKNRFFLVLIWIGLWGVVDNIMNIFVPDTNYRLRILIYAIIYIIAVTFYLSN